MTRSTDPRRSYQDTTSPAIINIPAATALPFLVTQLILDRPIFDPAFTTPEYSRLSTSLFLFMKQEIEQLTHRYISDLDDLSCVRLGSCGSFLQIWGGKVNEGIADRSVLLDDVLMI